MRQARHVKRGYMSSQTKQDIQEQRDEQDGK